MLAVLVLSVDARTAEGIERFIGYWSPADEDWCILPRAEWETDGGQMIIGKDSYFYGAHGRCTDVGQWMDSDRMRMSAACRSHDGGAFLPNMEFWITDDGLMHFRTSDGESGRVYRRCSEADLDRADGAAGSR